MAAPQHTHHTRNSPASEPGPGPGRAGELVPSVWTTSLAFTRGTLAESPSPLALARLSCKTQCVWDMLSAWLGAGPRPMAGGTAQKLSNLL